MRLVNMLMSVSQSCLLLEHDVVNLGEEERTELLAEFSRARRHMAFYFQVKGAFWQSLPWSLCGLAHYDRQRQESIAAGQGALQKYEVAGPAVRKHWLVQVVLTGLGRTQLIAYSDSSRTLSVLPFVRVIVSRMMFVPVVERWIEGQHAIISRFSGTLLMLLLYMRVL